MTSQIHFHQKNGLTVRHVQGSPSLEDLTQAIDKNYHSPTLKICWIIQEDATAHNLSIHDAKKLAAVIKKYAPERSGGQSAIVAPEHFEFAMARIIETHCDLLDIPFGLQVFRTQAEAAEWLDVPVDDLAQ